MSVRDIWIIEFGAYSDRYTDCAFTDVKDAIRYLMARTPGWSLERPKFSFNEEGYPTRIQLWTGVPHADATYPGAAAYETQWKADEASIRDAYNEVLAEP